MNYLFKNKALENKSVQLKTTVENSVVNNGPEGAVVVEKEGTQVNVCVSPNPEIEAKGPRESSSIALEGKFAVEINGKILPHSFNAEHLKDYFDAENSNGAGVFFSGKVPEIIRITAPLAYVNYTPEKYTYATGMIETPTGYKSVMLSRNTSVPGSSFVKEPDVEFDGIQFTHMHVAKDAAVFYNTDGLGEVGLASKKVDGTWVKYKGPMIERDVKFASFADSGWLAIVTDEGVEVFERTIDGVTNESTFTSKRVNTSDGKIKAVCWVRNRNMLLGMKEINGFVTDYLYVLNEGSGTLDQVYTGAPTIPAANVEPAGFLWVNNVTAIIGYADKVHRTYISLQTPSNSTSTVMTTVAPLSNPVLLTNDSASPAKILCTDPAAGTNGQWYVLENYSGADEITGDTYPPVEFPAPLPKDRVHFSAGVAANNCFACETVVGDPLDDVTEVKIYNYTAKDTLVVVE